MSIETNCFRIDGLDALNATYRLFQIVGLYRDGSDYYGNCTAAHPPVEFSDESTGDIL